MSDTLLKPLPDRDSWPKRPSGTTDWEDVFEHPETGLLAHIGRVETAADLRSTTQAVIALLFPRKADADEAARLTAELADIISDDLDEMALKSVVSAVQQMLRTIKTFRQKKAAEYEKEQEGKSAQEKSAERRKGGPSPPVSIKKAIARKRKTRLVAALVALAVLGGGGFAAYYTLDFSSLSSSPSSSPQQRPKKLAYCDFPKVTVVLKNETSRVVHSAVIAVTAEFSGADALPVCQAAQPRILDALQIFLRNTTYEELQGTGGSELLRAETLNIVNAEVGPFRANTVLFKQILIQ